MTTTDDIKGCVLCGKPKVENDRHFCVDCKADQDAQHHRRNVDHTWHVWMNQRQDERRKRGLEHESSLYEFKSALEEVRRLPHLLKAARTGTLPTNHRQCSYSPLEPIVNNRVFCVLGKDVTECPILASLYACAATQAESEYYRDVTPDSVDELAGRTCVWHIYTTKLTDQHWLDTSEGYLQDEGDRMFWRNLYDSLDGADEVGP